MSTKTLEDMTPREVKRHVKYGKDGFPRISKWLRQRLRDEVKVLYKDKNTDEWFIGE